MSRAFIIVLTGLLLGLNAFANDVLLPAFFVISEELKTPVEAVQGLVPLFLIAAGVGQLIAGPASDRYGRRPVMIAGLALFIAGSLVCATATSILALQIGRMVQGLGSAFGVVVSRATLRDTHTGALLASTMALAMTIFSAGPIAAPIVGVGLLQLAGWRAIFIGVALVGIVLIATVLLRHRETHSQRDVNALKPAVLLAAFKAVLIHPQSRRFLAVACLQQALIIMMVANSPRLFQSQFGIDGATYAILFALSAFGIIAGQFINHRMIARLGVLNATRAASLLVTVVMAAIAGLAHAGVLTLPLFLAGITLFNVGFLVVLANSASMVLEPHHTIAGVTASFFGFATQMSGSLIALGTFSLYAGRMLPWAIGMAGISAVVLTLLASTAPSSPSR